MSVNPTITVLMAVYNGERYLRQAVDSILAQTWEDFEFMLVFLTSVPLTAIFLIGLAFLTFGKLSSFPSDLTTC